MSIDFKFAIGSIVCHITDTLARGVVVAVIQRGGSKSYEVQWGLDKCIWHIELELAQVVTSDAHIGFTPTPTPAPPMKREIVKYIEVKDKHDLWVSDEAMVEELAYIYLPARTLFKLWLGAFWRFIRYGS